MEAASFALGVGTMAAAGAVIKWSKQPRGTTRAWMRRVGANIRERHQERVRQHQEREKLRAEERRAQAARRQQYDDERRKASADNTSHTHHDTSWHDHHHHDHSHSHDTGSTPWN